MQWHDDVRFFSFQISRVPMAVSRRIARHPGLRHAIKEMARDNVARFTSPSVSIHGGKGGISGNTELD